MQAQRSKHTLCGVPRPRVWRCGAAAAALAQDSPAPPAQPQARAALPPNHAPTCPHAGRTSDAYTSPPAAPPHLSRRCPGRSPCDLRSNSPCRPRTHVTANTSKHRPWSGIRSCADCASCRRAAQPPHSATVRSVSSRTGPSERTVARSVYAFPCVTWNVSTSNSRKPHHSAPPSAPA